MSLSSDHSAPRTAQRFFERNAHDKSAHDQNAHDDASKDKLKDTIRGRCAQPHCRKEGSFPAPCADERRHDERLSGRHSRTWLCLEHARDANGAWNIFERMSDAEVERAVRAAAVGERPTWPINAPFRKGKDRHDSWHNSSHDSWQDSSHDASQDSLHDSFGDSLRRFCGIDIATEHRGTRDSLRPPLRPPLGDSLAKKTHDEQELSSGASERRHPRTSVEREACRVMSLTPPISVQQLKARYRALAKTHHPDQLLAKNQDTNQKQQEKAQQEKAQQEKAQQEKAQQEGFKRINAAYALLQALWQRAPQHEQAMRRNS